MLERVANASREDVNVHNAEHAGPGLPAHHLADPDLVRLHRDAEGA